ncbi:hypothetical protein LCGC14_0428890 [marine sediment metagenome]|uniref:HNH nuclease domain-containing protein n=1 Tax=marine sediment metagenome TaxID=412755 RepID=A0A0F9VAM7_9ZZZZ
MPKIPKLKKKRKKCRYVGWKKDAVTSTTRELCAVVSEHWDGNGIKKSGIPSAVEELLAPISKIVLGRLYTLEDVRNHIRETQDGREFSLNALLQRGDKLKRNNEYGPFRNYVLSAYLKVIGGPVREDFTQDMIDERLEIAGGRCEYRGCDLKITGYVADHYIPVKRGGRGSRDNIRIACPRCNREKFEMDPEEFILKIQKDWSRARKI